MIAAHRLRGIWWLPLVILGHVACQPAPSTSVPPAAGPAPPPPAEARQAPAGDLASPPGYDLGRDEARGGHTLARHVGRSDADLKDRLRREPNISAASTYSDRATAERTVARALARNRPQVDRWLARQGSRPNLVLDYRGSPGDEAIGRSLPRRSAQSVPCSDAVVVLRWDGQRGFVVLTSYPEARR